MLKTLFKNVPVTRSNVTHSGIAHSTITKQKQIDWDQWCCCIQSTHQEAPQINSARRGKNNPKHAALKTLTNSDHRILQKVRFFGKTNILENSRKHFDQSRKRQTSLNLKLTIRKFYSKKCVQRMKRIAEDWPSLPSAMQQSPTVHNPNKLLLPQNLNLGWEKQNECCAWSNLWMTQPPLSPCPCGFCLPPLCILPCACT